MTRAAARDIVVRAMEGPGRVRGWERKYRSTERAWQGAGTRVIQRSISVPPNEPTQLRPRADPARDGAFSAFLRPGIWTLAASVALVVVTAIITVRVLRSRGSPPQAETEIFRALGSRPLDAPPSSATGATGGPGAAAFPAPASLPDAARASLAVVDEVERGHAAGEWSVARKRFDPCPGEDVERVAWIDVWSRILKMTGTRGDVGAAVTVEQWFDREGRLRAVRAEGAGPEPWKLRALLDERGGVAYREGAGAAPSVESLSLTARDPSTAFFEKPRCGPGRK